MIASLIPGMDNIYVHVLYYPYSRTPPSRRSTFGVALVLATITMQVGVVYTSISAYPLLSAYFLTTYAYKRMRLITRVYSTLIQCASDKEVKLSLRLPISHKIPRFGHLGIRVLIQVLSNIWNGKNSLCMFDIMQS